MPDVLSPFCKKVLFAISIVSLFIVYVPYSLAQTLQCDANGDGKVDGIDYLYWAIHYGQVSSHGTSDGDYNNDGIVDGRDFVIWFSNYGRVDPATSPIIPPQATSTPTPIVPQTAFTGITNGQTVTGNIFVTYESDKTSTKSVSFYFDAATTPYHTETVYPFALNGNLEDATQTILAYSTLSLSNGSHTLRVLVTYINAQTKTDLISFFVNNLSVTSQPSGTRAPTPTGSVCYVKVAGYIYNMQSAVGITLRDPNTGKTRTHSRSNFNCGTLANPTDMTNTYLSKHGPMGCAERLKPYIVTPPAPIDPTCQ